MKIKIVALAISVEWLITFFDVSQLSYKPSNFARANKPYAMGYRVNQINTSDSKLRVLTTACPVNGIL